MDHALDRECAEEGRGYNFNIRKNLLEYDASEPQRRAVYAMRRKALAGEDVRDMVVEAINASSRT